ncbi:MAG: heme o synthase [Phycisphaerales bacterium]
MTSAPDTTSTETPTAAAGADTVVVSEANAGATVARRSRRHANDGVVGMIAELTKARLNGLVLVTTAVGYLLATTRTVDWNRFFWTMLGTACAAASASMLNQLLEKSRDGRMHRTRHRPLPSERISRPPVLIGGVLLAYAGVTILAVNVNLLTAMLALLNVGLYILVYTPLKPKTTLNTLVGAVCGAIPPMMGWSAVTGGVHTGAWILGAILFVWQMPHFLALAWMYRDDYRRGGMKMLAVVDPLGEITARTMVITSLLLAPLGLATTMAGLAGWVAAAVNLVLALMMTALAWGFYATRSDGAARRMFLASIIYLPLALVVLVLDRGSVSPVGELVSGRSNVVYLEAPK